MMSEPQESADDKDPASPHENAAPEMDEKAASPDGGEHADETLIIPVTPDGDLAPGMVISNTFRIVRLLGRGGMGQVYLAEHTFQRTLHALKRISPHLSNDEKYMSLFRREAELLRKLNSEAIVGYDGVIVHEDRGQLSAFLAMEFAEGPSLKNLVREKGPLPPEQCIKLLRRVAGGLGAAHDRGVFHRDISPENIILAEGGCERAKIIDFGIAREDRGANDEATLLGGGFAGKLGYASPEQFGLHRGMIDARTDIYALGLSVFYAATGQALFRSSDIFAARESRLVSPSLDECPLELKNILARMLAPDPEDRPASMKGVVALIDEPLATGTPLSAPVGERRAVTGSERKRTKPKSRVKASHAVAARYRPVAEKRKGNTLALAGSAAIIVALLAVAAFTLGDRRFAPSGSRPATDRQILRFVKDANDAHPGCLWLPYKDDQLADGQVMILAIKLAGDCAAAEQAMRSGAASAGLGVKFEDGSKYIGDTFAAATKPWLENFGSAISDPDIKITFPNSSGDAVRSAGGLYDGPPQAPGDFSVRVDYVGPRARLYPDIMRFDGWLYRQWQDDPLNLRMSGWPAAGASITTPNPAFLKSLDDLNEPSTWPTRFEFLVGVTDAPTDVAVGAVIALASDIEKLPCDRIVGSLKPQQLKHSEISNISSANWAQSISGSCVSRDETSAMRIALFAWIPPDRAGDFLLE